MAKEKEDNMSDDTTNNDSNDSDAGDVKGVEARFNDLDDTMVEFSPLDSSGVEKKEERTDAEALSILLLQQDVQGLKEQLATVTREKDDLYDRLLRKLADFNNYKKRIEKEKQDYFMFATANLIRDLLPVLDNFEKALAQCKDTDTVSYQGLGLIFRQIREVFKKLGVEPIDAVGLQFDPNFHEAADRVENSEIEDNIIVEEFQKGYMINNKLLRPAMVKVNIKPADKNLENPDKEVGDHEESNRD
jgi:molecular chaperone GrpE